ncbi:MAG: hypothetical protein ACOC9Y_05570 [Chloroflexota bacterium]
MDDRETRPAGQQPDSGGPNPAAEAVTPAIRGGEPDQEWRPEPGPGFLLGGVILAAAMVVFLFALTQVTAGAGGSRMIWMLVLVLSGFFIPVVVYLLVGLRRLRYVLTADRLLIETPRWNATIPFADIVDIVYQPRDEIRLNRREWFWPGYRVSVSETDEGVWHSAATLPPNRRIRIRTRTGATYAISPWRPVRFVEALVGRVSASRRATGGETAAPPPAPVPQQALPSPPASEARRRPIVIVSEHLASRFRAYRLFRDVLLHDRVMSEAVALALAILAAMAIYTVYRGDGVNLPIPARWDRGGEPTYWLRPDGFWVFEGIWLYVVIGSVIFVTNVAIGTFLLIVDQFLARLVVLATPALILVAFLAVLQVTA